MEDPEKTQPIHKKTQSSDWIPPDLRFGSEPETKAKHERSNNGDTKLGEELPKAIRESFGDRVLVNKVSEKQYAFIDVELENPEHIGELRFRDVSESMDPNIFTYLTDQDIRWDPKTHELILGEDWELLPVIQGHALEEEQLLEQVSESGDKSPDELEKLSATLSEYYEGKTIRSLGDHKEFVFDKVVHDDSQKHPHLLMLHQATNEENVLVLDPEEFLEQFRVE